MQENTRKIIILTTAFAPLVGGSEIAIDNIARRLPNVTFDILTPRYRRSSARRQSYGNISIRRIGLGMSFDKWLFPILAPLYALLPARRGNFRLMHAYQASYAAGAAWVLKFLCPRLPFLLTLQEGKDLSRQPWIIRFLRRILIRRADRITVISNYLRDYVLGLRQTASVDVIPNGVDPAFFADVSEYSREATRSRLNIGRNEKVIISVSRLVIKNGLTNLLRAFAIVVGAHPVKLILAGDGKLKTELAHEAIALNIADKVLFIGTVGHVALPEYLAVSDVFARPSLSEGLGSAFLEAMAAGVPVVASAVGGIPDFLKDGVNGLFCNPHDPDDIAKKIIRIFEGDAFRDRIVYNARELVRKEYSWDTAASRMGVVYNMLTN